MASRGIMTSMPATPRPLLTSATNPTVKAAAALRDRRQRDRTGLTLVDGAREVRRALDAGVTVTEVFVCEPLLAGPDARAVLDRLSLDGVTVHPVSEHVFAKIAFGDRAEGLLAVVRVPSVAIDDLRLPPDPLVVVLEGVEKPGNIGAVLRSMDGAGADALILADPRTDAFNPNAIRASAGTIFSLPVGAASTESTMTWLRDRNLRLVVARVDAERLYTDVDLTGPLAIALGAETGGLTPAWSVSGAEAVRVPMLGTADSLNVSVCAAVLIYEARRQRGMPARTL
jgi:TrmH family RNA methyltransferase